VKEAHEADFRVFYCFEFSGQPEDSYFENMGMEKYQLAFEGLLTDNNGDPSKRVIVDEKVELAAKAMESHRPFHGIMGFDVEFLETGYDSGLSPEESGGNAATLARLVETARRAAPGAALGMYGVVPCFSPSLFIFGASSETDGDIELWKEYNDGLFPLIRAVDYLAPSLYLCYNEEDYPYKSYAIPIVREAKRIGAGKPIYPFVSPQYHVGSMNNGKAASYAAWKNVLETIKGSGAQGIIIFAGDGYMGDNPPGWNDSQNQGWKLALADFMGEIR
jgi:hypothetical protein